MCRLEKIDYYNTVTGKLEEVLVSEEVAQFIRRSYWKEKMQERRFYERVIEYENMLNRDKMIYTNNETDHLNKIIEKYTWKRLKEACNTLSEEQKFCLKLIYEENATLSSIAAKLKISNSLMSRRMKQIYKQLKMILEEDI